MNSSQPLRDLAEKHGRPKKVAKADWKALPEGLLQIARYAFRDAKGTAADCTDDYIEDLLVLGISIAKNEHQFCPTCGKPKEDG